ncbi:dihydroorotase [Thorsellia kenyensis]|uniref:Dihydroorotase n=1 Tax=Thorsellia kenyensis TaxID=1549888 RepID=A0ABV6C6S7_9GAMM
MQTTLSPQSITLRKPDDWHLHLRDEDILKAVLPYTSRHFKRAIIMPNLTKPITTLEAAQAYRDRVIAAIPSGDEFMPLMTCYLSRDLNKSTLIEGKRSGLITATKLYPAHATTNSSHGIADIKEAYELFETMQKIGMPLLIHGEVTDKEIDIFDREAVFIERTLLPLRKHFPELKIVLEHITTKEAAEFILAADDYTAATITPQHLLFNRNDMLVGGIRPHLFCLPILKRNIHQKALRQAIASGNKRLFLGTDSAPHFKHLKESACGCAGAFNSLNALSIYTQVFDEMNALEYLEAFCSENGARFYEMPLNEGTITMTKLPELQPTEISVNEHVIVPFMAGETLPWQVS